MMNRMKQSIGFLKKLIKIQRAEVIYSRLRVIHGVCLTLTVVISSALLISSAQAQSQSRQQRLSPQERRICRDQALAGASRHEQRILFRECRRAMLRREGLAKTHVSPSPNEKEATPPRPTTTPPDRESSPSPVRLAPPSRLAPEVATPLPATPPMLVTPPVATPQVATPVVIAPEAPPPATTPQVATPPVDPIPSIVAAPPVIAPATTPSLPDPLDSTSATSPVATPATTVLPDTTSSSSSLPLTIPASADDSKPVDPGNAQTGEVVVAADSAEATCPFLDEEVFARYHKLGENYGNIDKTITTSNANFKEIQKEVLQAEGCSPNQIEKNQREIDLLTSLPVQGWMEESIRLNICAGLMMKKIDNEMQAETRPIVLNRLMKNADRSRHLGSDLTDISRGLAYLGNKTARLIEGYQSNLDACAK